MDPQNILNGHPEGSAVELSGKLRQAFDHLLRPSSDSDEDADWDLLLPTALADRTLERIRVREDRDFAASLLDRALGEGEPDAEPNWDSRLAPRLTESLAVLMDDGLDAEPPRDLALRTLKRVRERSRPRYVPWEFGSRGPAIRWRDVAAAAAVLITGLMMIFPAILRARAQRDLIVCTDNLRQAGMASLATFNGRSPTAPASVDRPFINSWLAAIQEMGLDPAKVLDCPVNGRNDAVTRLPSVEELRGNPRTNWDEARRRLDIDYAFSLGCGECGREHDELWPSHAVPLISDRPACDANGLVQYVGNSPNHHGLGQNVFYSDGHVGWTTRRQVFPDDDDIFLNRRRLPRPGLHVYDAVLVPAYYHVQDQF